MESTEHVGAGKHGSVFVVGRLVGWLVVLKASHLKKGYCIFKTLTELTEKQRPTSPRLGCNQPPFSFVFFYLQVIWVRIVGPPGKRMRKNSKQHKQNEENRGQCKHFFFFQQKQQIVPYFSLFDSSMFCSSLTNTCMSVPPCNLKKNSNKEKKMYERKTS